MNTNTRPNCPFTTFYFLLLLFTPLLFSSCQRELEYRGGETQPLMVVEGVMQEGENLSLLLSHSKFFLDNSSIQGITDANVQYQINSGEWLSMGKGKKQQKYYALYTCDYVCQAGDTVNITITHKDYPDVSMQQIILPAPAISVSHQISNNNDLHLTFHLTRGDLPEDAILLLQTQVFSEITYIWMNDTAVYYRDNMVDMNSYDPILGQAANASATDDEIGLPINGQYEDYRFYVPVAAFNNSHDLEVTVSPFLFESTIEQYTIVDSVFVYASSLTADYYAYLASKEKYVGSEVFGNFFAEKVQIHSNIEGGIGIFGSCTTAVIPIPYSTRK